MDNNIIFSCIHGSHLYGLNTPNSDVDYKGVFVPALRDIILKKDKSEDRSSTGPAHGKNLPGDVDRVNFSLHKFLDMACNGDTIALDMIHAPSNPDCVLGSSPHFQYIYDHRHRFYTTEMKSFYGYCRKQAAKYGIKGSKIHTLEEVLKSIPSRMIGRLSDIIDQLPVNEFCRIVHEPVRNKPDGTLVRFYEVLGSKYQDSIFITEFESNIKMKLSKYGTRARQAQTNDGVDWKAVSHALRAGYQLKEIFTTHDLKFPLKERETVLDVKLGRRDFTSEVQPLLEDLMEEIRELSSKSDLPENVDKKFWDEFILDVYRREYGIDLNEQN